MDWREGRMAQARGLAAVWVRGDAGLTLTVVVEIEWGGGEFKSNLGSRTWRA